MEEKDKEKISVPKGIGGWLILPIIGLCYSLYVLGYDLVLALSIEHIVFTEIGWLIILDIGLLLFVSYTLMLLINKRKKAPTFIIILLWLNVATSLVSFILLGDEELFLYIISSVIWTIYFKKSKRVKNTFVE